MKVRNIRKTSTRQMIVEVFIELLRHKDIEKVTIKDITEQANINRATFYAHFEDKYQLFDEMTKDSAIEIIKLHTKERYTWDEKEIRNVFQAILDYLQQVKESCPYSYQNLFPLLRVKMLDALNIHLQLCFHLNEVNDIDRFHTLLYSGILYDSAELLVVEKTNLSQNKIVEEVSLLILNK